MAKLNLTEAAKAAGIGRTTLYNHIKEGKISCEVNEKGKKVIDVTELIRVYGEIKNPETSDERSVERQTEHDGTGGIVQVLQEQIKELRKDKENLRQDLEVSRKREEGLLEILKQQQTLLLPAGSEVKGANEDTARRNKKKETSKRRRDSKKRGFFGRLFGGK